MQLLCLPEASTQTDYIFFLSKMLFMLLFFNILKFISASSNFILDNFEIMYSISAENVCHEESGRFQIKFGFSVQHCVKACGARKHCLALNYRSRGNICELFESSDSGLLKPGDCLYLSKENINVIKVQIRVIMS